MSKRIKIFSFLLIFFVLIYYIYNSYYCKIALEDLITICKVSKDTIRIDYLHSNYGISKIDYEIKDNIMLLKIDTKWGKFQKSYDVKIPEEVRLISTGEKQYDIDKINYCSKIYSGEEAIEHLKTLK